MKIDDLRAHILLSWIGGLVACYLTLIAAAARRYAGLTFAQIDAPARHLSAAVVPTLLVLIGTYFSEDLKTVRLKAGQRRVLLVLSYLYVLSFMFITGAMLWMPGFGLDQDATEQHPAVNRYLILTYCAQPLIVAALFFVFRKGSGRSPKAGS